MNLELPNLSRISADMKFRFFYIILFFFQFNLYTVYFILSVSQLVAA